MSSFFENLFKKSRSLPGLDARFFATVDCDGCGECERRCPTGHIKMVDGRPLWPKLCLLCASCGSVCPNDAIRYATEKDIEEYWRLVKQTQQNSED